MANHLIGMPAEAAIKINNSTDIDISGLNIVGASNTGNAISIMNGSQRVRIHDNRFGSTTGSGKDGQGQPMNAAGVYVSSSLFTDIFQNTFFGNAQGLVFDAASGVINASKVNKNWFSAQVNDGFVEKGNFASYGLEFKGNSVESSGGYGVNLWSGGGWEFGGNYFESNTLGEMNFGNTCVGVGIHGNLISSLATLGPMIAITSSGAKSSGFDISGNQIDIASSSGTMAAAITVDLNDSIIHDNSANLVGGTITDLVKISTGALRVAVWNNNKNPGSAGTVTNLLHDIPAGVTSTGPLFWLREIPLGFAGTTFGSLPASSNGTIIYCSDCKIASSCAPGGTGAFAKRLNGAWVCN